MNKSFSPALYNGITLAIFISSGKMPELKDKLQMHTKGFEMDLMTLYITFMLIPSYPVDFVGLHSHAILAISNSSVSNKNMASVTGAFM